MAAPLGIGLGVHRVEEVRHRFCPSAVLEHNPLGFAGRGVALQDGVAAGVVGDGEDGGAFHRAVGWVVFGFRLVPMSLRGLRGALDLGWQVRMATTSSVWEMIRSIVA